MDARLVSRQGLADHYDIGLRTVDRWKNRRLVSCQKIRRVVRFDLNVVEKEIKERFGLDAKKPR